MPKPLKESDFAVWKQTMSATGRPQNNAERPRTNRPKDRISSGLVSGVGIANPAIEARLKPRVTFPYPSGCHPGSRGQTMTTYLRERK